MDRAAIVACPIMVVGVVMSCGGCPPEHPKKRPPMSQLGQERHFSTLPSHVRLAPDSDWEADITGGPRIARRRHAHIFRSKF
jgi:hypothetical protein